MKKTIAILVLCAFMGLTAIACGGKADGKTDSSTSSSSVSVKTNVVKK